MEDLQIQVLDVVRDEGSVVVFAGYIDGDPDKRIFFASDHRPANDIINALNAGEDVTANVPGWAVLSRG